MAQTTAEFVTQLFTYIYGRAPTSAELNAQIGRIDIGGISSNQVATEMIDSAAGLNAQAIARIYLAAFGRYPDLGGLLVQENAVINGGTTLQQLTTNFTATAEFAAKFPTGTGAAAYITALYTNVLGRAPDAAGLAIQIAAYNDYPGTTTAKQSEFLYRFAQSAELTTNRSGEIKAVIAYAAIDGQIPTSTAAQQGGAIPLATLVSVLNDGVLGNGPNIGRVYTLTEGIDVLTNTVSGSTFVAQLGATNTLQAADNINAAPNSDTGFNVLRVVTDGGSPTSSTGVTAKNIYMLEVQSQSVGGTTIDVANFTGLSEVHSTSSTQPLTVTGARTPLSYSVTTGQSVGTVTIAGGTDGAADTSIVTLNGNTVTSLTYDGIETFSVSNSTTASTITTLASNTAKALLFSGNALTTITNTVAGVTTIDASASTGGVVVIADGSRGVTFTGGAGADQITYAPGTLTEADAVNGGGGVDTLVTTFADISTGNYAAAARITNVENISFTDNLAGTYNSSKVAGDLIVTLQAGFTDGAVIDSAPSGFTVANQLSSTGTLTVNITGATETANVNDVLNLVVGKAGAAGFSSGTIVAAGVETINIASAASTTVNSLGLGDPNTSKIVITGAGALTLAATAGASLTVIDASAATGAIDLSGVTNYKATGATITGGSGADILSGSAGADTIFGGAGNDTILGSLGADTITLDDGVNIVRYASVDQSQANQVDTITDFLSGVDWIDLSAIAAGRAINYLGTIATNAQALVRASTGQLQVVFQADTHTLWVDANDDGALNGNDFQLVLRNVTTIVAADVRATIGVTAGGNGDPITVPLTGQAGGAGDTQAAHQAAVA